MYCKMQNKLTRGENIGLAKSISHTNSFGEEQDRHRNRNR